MISKQQRAFTLIELLVVLAVLALLMTIVVPSLRRAKSMAKALCCKANLKGLYVAEVLYSDDYNGWLPSATKTEGLGGHWGFRAAKGYQAEYDRRGLSETYGLNALFDDLGYVPSSSKVWVCTDLGMDWMADDYKCTYSFSIAGILAKKRYNVLAGTGGSPHSILISDNVVYYTPTPVGWYVESTAKPQSVIPTDERVMPHQYLARTTTNEYGEETVDYDTYMIVTIDGWVGTNGQNKERMGLE